MLKRAQGDKNTFTEPDHITISIIHYFCVCMSVHQGIVTLIGPIEPGSKQNQGIKEHFKETIKQLIEK